MTQWIVVIAAASIAVAGAGCSGAGGDHRRFLSKRLNIPALPATTEVESCAKKDLPDVGPIMVCTLRTNAADVASLTSGHSQFRAVNGPPGTVGHGAALGDFNGVHSINIFFAESTGKAVVEVYEPFK